MLFFSMQHRNGLIKQDLIEIVAEIETGKSLEMMTGEEKKKGTEKRIGSVIEIRIDLKTKIGKVEKNDVKRMMSIGTTLLSISNLITL